MANDAGTFRSLHEDGLLVLPNAWDAGTARLVESRGAKAIATTSSGVAWSHGYPDGDALPVRLLVATAAAIARVVRVPVSMDVEGGYSSEPAAVGQTVAAVVEAGAVGINIEDGSSPPELLCAKVEAVKRAVAARGGDVFVNVRTDVYLRGLAAEDRRVAETLARAERYRAAGADGIFVPGLMDRAEIRAVAAGTPLPLNVMAWPGLPPLAELQGLGVRRLSAGSAIAQAVLGLIASRATAFLRDGASEAVSADGLPYADVNALMNMA